MCVEIFVFNFSPAHRLLGASCSLIAVIMLTFLSRENKCSMCWLVCAARSSFPHVLSRLPPSDCGEGGDDNNGNKYYKFMNFKLFNERSRNC
jgi:hypothetical protein